MVFANTYEVNSETDAEPILQKFFTEVNRSAVSRGILTDPITHTVGIMEGSQIYDLIDELSQARGKVYLSAYAREETNSIGPLRLNIKLNAVN